MSMVKEDDGVVFGKVRTGGNVVRLDKFGKRECAIYGLARVGDIKMIKICVIICLYYSVSFPKIP